MTYVMVDIEADGPIPGDFSMISFGAIVIDQSLDKVFYRELKPISDKFVPEALAVSGFSREKTLTFSEPKKVMEDFSQFLKSHSDGRLIFIADNNGFDWQFINWYFHHFTGGNPFGHSSMNLNSLFKGLKKDIRANFKYLKKTKHDHNPVNDAKGNAEAFLEMQKMGLKV